MFQIRDEIKTSGVDWAKGFKGLWTIIIKLLLLSLLLSLLSLLLKLRKETSSVAKCLGMEHFNVKLGLFVEEIYDYYYSYPF